MKLIFVYNAKSGSFNTILDIAHKLLSPKSYSCNLCALTYSTFSEQDIWKKFKSEINIPMTFFHSDEFEAKYGETTFIYPIILSEHHSNLKTFMSANDINAIETLEGLIEIIKQKLEVTA